MGKIVGGWDRPEVAQAQHDLVLKELSVDPATIGPYAAFQWAMETIAANTFENRHALDSYTDGGRFIHLNNDTMPLSLLDVGCGAGHYGVLCERFYPRIRYHGTDISPVMIAQARLLVPISEFNVCEFKDNFFCDYDIVLTGQTIELTDDPPAMLDLLLTCSKRYVILNRIRLTPDESHRIMEGTYCGEMGRTWLWNRKDITERIEKRAQIVAVNDWWASDQMTFVVKRLENDKSTELCGCADATACACTCA